MTIFRMMQKDFEILCCLSKIGQYHWLSILGEYVKSTQGIYFTDTVQYMFISFAYTVVQYTKWTKSLKTKKEKKI